MEPNRQNGTTQSALKSNSAAEREVAAQALAARHYELEDGLTRIFRIKRKDDAKANSCTEPIRLLEINVNTVASGILPLQFGPMPASGVPFPSIIVEVTPDEFEMLKRNELQLPDNWEIGEEFPKAVPIVGASNGN